ncbi:outer membrane beta-barrel protein [Marinicella sp. S1101]|uniref:outer membrane protein n=1 Tax=Marinicella marina TaxID=2996016 RepID=UPI002260F976|nr:outer membrane beta-barrel protein [Marinicella marina]MCX7553085.1 outer membrane beta-barrel protein [Marinicella marina]MDJ1138816.1 outer membrane beta-barrel protein [Marinicella marina]
MGKRILSALGFSALVMSGQVMAQTTDWKGCYAGVSASIVETDNQWTTAVFRDTVRNENAGSDRADDTAAGIQFGCDFYQSDHWVVGAKLTANDNTVNASHLYQGGIGPDNFISYESEDMVSAIIRLGFKASDNGLIYGNLGYTTSKHVYRDNSTIPVEFAFSKRDTQTGVLVGVGYEHMLKNNFSLFAEYNYTDLGENRVSLDDLIAPPTNYLADVEQDIAQFSIGVNYRF